LNDGFVPILEVPNPKSSSLNGGIIVTESLNIMEFLDKVTGEEDFCKTMPVLKDRISKTVPLYSSNS